jgi:glycosyltransferase involved in cell wall biosynthesis
LNKKKILQVCAIDTSVEALLKPLVQESLKEGYIVHNACSNTGKFNTLKEQGLCMVEIKIERKINLFSNIKSLIELTKLIKNEKYDIVHVHTPIAALLGRIAAKLAGTKNIVYTAHGFYFHDEMSNTQYKLFYNIEKFAARFFTDWLLLQSKEDYDLSIKDKFLKNDRIVHLSNGVDLFNKFNPSKVNPNIINKLKFNLKIKENDVVFCFIGRLVEEKGLFELIKAFSMLERNYQNVKLILIGDFLESERDQDSYLKIKELMKSTNILHLGYRKEIPELISLSDVFVLPSYREGLPRSIIEAMGMEKPIIATDIRGCREEVIDGINGYLVEKESVISLYEAMKKLFLNKKKRIDFGKASRKIAEQDFNEDIVIKKQIELFNHLTKG